MTGRRIFLLAGGACACLAGAVGCGARNLVEYRGAITPAMDWRFQEAQSDGELVYIPFEGYYKDKGGRLISPVIQLDKEPDEFAFYLLEFTGRAPERCYWWVDYLDADGNPLPDCNSAVYPGTGMRRYRELFPAHVGAAAIRLQFASEAGVEVADVTVRRATWEEAAAWCGETARELEPVVGEPLDAMAELLPRTRRALTSGEPFRVVMLGDSIVNDSFTSCFPALVRRDFPDSDLTFIVSVRGATGCWYYQDPEHFREYVAAYRPDLVMVGGISNVSGDGDPAGEMLRVIEQCRELGCEVVVMSAPLSRDWRQSPEDRAWDDARVSGAGDFQRRAAEAAGAAFWDLTRPCQDYLAASGRPLGYFNRNEIHNNDRGKQVIGQVLAAYFRALQ